MSAEAVSAERALDGLLATLQHGDLSALELRILIRLAERQSDRSELAGVLEEAKPAAISHAIRRLTMRGLIARRSDRGPRARFVLTITSLGLQAVAPLVEWVSEAQPPGNDGLWRSAGPAGEAADSSTAEVR